MSKQKAKHNFGSGKYTVILEEDGKLHALRYGEHWRDLTGDNLIMAMFDDCCELKQHIGDLKAENERLNGECEGCPMSIAEDLRKERNSALVLLREFRSALKCENLHHRKDDQHGNQFGEQCKVLARIDTLLSKYNKSPLSALVDQ